MSLGFNLLLGVNDLLGPGVLFAFVAGRYYHPRREERILLFIDMRASTSIAERLGEQRFLGRCQTKFPGRLTVVVSGHERPVPVFQQLARSDPSGRDDVREVPSVAAQCRGSPGRARDRHQP
jgi:hypothetical protein